jgi:N-acetylglucosamine-6-phosphate deacetylase
MRPLGHRDPGIAGAALARDDVVVQLILDGHHLAEETVRVVWRAAAGRVALVSDAIAAAGMGDGSYRLGSVEVEVRDGVARRENGVLAGSVLSLIDAVRNLYALDVPLEDAVGAATTVPARVARRPDLGSLRPGADADVVVLDDALEIRAVFVGGQELVAA